MDINFNQLMAEAGEGFQPIPAGPYTVECEKAEAVKSSTNKPQIRVTLRVLGGQHNGRKLFDQFTLTAGNPAALGFFFDNMAAFGLGRDFFSQLQMEDPMPYVAQMLLGRQCNIAVGIEPYQGVDRNKVKQYRPIAGGQAPPAMPQQGAMPGYVPAPVMGAMPVAQPQAPQPQFQPQQPQQPPMPPGFAPQQPQMPPQQAPQPQPQYAQPPQQPVQEQAPWQQQAAAYPQQLPEQQYQQPPAPVAQPAPPQQAYAPVPPGQQQGQPEAAPMWQPSGPPPGYVDPNQQAQPPQAPPPVPQGVPPMPGVPGRGI
jgi:hypothetical protein